MNSNRINPKKSTPRHMTVKLVNTEDKLLKIIRDINYYHHKKFN